MYEPFSLAFSDPARETSTEAQCCDTISQQAISRLGAGCNRRRGEAHLPRLAGCGLSARTVFTRGSLGRSSHFRPSHGTHRLRGRCGASRAPPRAGVWSGLLATHEDVTAVKVKEAHNGTATEWRRLGNYPGDRFAKLGADAHKPAMRVSHAVCGFKFTGPTAARWAAEAHVILRRREWRGTMDLERAPRCAHQEEAATICHGRTGRRQLRGFVQLTGTERSGRPKVVWRTRPTNTPKSWVKGEGGKSTKKHVQLQGRRLQQAPASVPSGAWWTQRPAAQDESGHFPHTAISLTDNLRRPTTDPA